MVVTKEGSTSVYDMLALEASEGHGSPQLLLGGLKQMLDVVEGLITKSVLGLPAK